jgi:hypothetical protein
MSQWISDHTPSIEDMRGHYEETHFYAPHTNSVKEKNAEFDRFLELVYQVERERIIKLLNQLIEQRPEDWTHAKGFWFEDVIALIKGETNE